MRQTLLILPIMAIIATVIIVKALIQYYAQKKGFQTGETNETSTGWITQGSCGNPLTNIKWGLILIGIGFPLLLDHLSDAISHEGTIGLMAICAGVGFLIYYFIAKAALGRQKVGQQPEEKSE